MLPQARVLPLSALHALPCDAHTPGPGTKPVRH